MNLDILVDRNISPSASCNPTQLSPQVDVDLQAEELLVHGMSREDGAESCSFHEELRCVPMLKISFVLFGLVENLLFWWKSWNVGQLVGSLLGGSVVFIFLDWSHMIDQFWSGKNWTDSHSFAVLPCNLQGLFIPILHASLP